MKFEIIIYVHYLLCLTYKHRGRRIFCMVIRKISNFSKLRHYVYSAFYQYIYKQPVDPQRVGFTRVKMTHSTVVLLQTTGCQRQSLVATLQGSLTTFMGLLNQRVRFLDRSPYTCLMLYGTRKMKKCRGLQEMIFLETLLVSRFLTVCYILEMCLTSINQD